MATVLTNVGKGILSRRVKNTGQAEPLYVGIGTGAGTAAASDTVLGTEVETRALGTSSVVQTTISDDTYQVVGTIPITASRTIVEAGLFTASTNGDMFISADFPAINLSSGDSIQLTIGVQFA